MGFGIGLTDSATLNDSLEIKDNYINGLSSFIKDCKTPMVISIQGAPGLGSTSIMKMIADELSIDVNCKCVEFNPWLFSHFDLGKDLPIVMLQSIIDSLGDDSGESTSTVQKILKGASSIGAGLLSSTAGFDNMFEKGLFTQLRDLKQETQLLINKKAGIIGYSEKLDKKHPEHNYELLYPDKDAVGKNRVVFFIDDLDKLSAPAAVELLEVIKNYLDCSNCVFVVAVDYDHICHGYATKYKTDIEAGKSFFDKVVQLTFSVPTNTYDLRPFIDWCIKELNIDCPDFEKNSERFFELADYSVRANPRALKQIFNKYAMLTRLMDRGTLENSKNRELLFALLCMQQAYEGIYKFGVENIEKFSSEDFSLLERAKVTELKKRFPDCAIDADELEKAMLFLSMFAKLVIDADDMRTFNYLAEESVHVWIKK